MKSTWILLTLAFMVSGSTFALDGKEVMTRHEEARKSPKFTAKAILRTVKGPKTQEKAFTIWSKLKADGIRYSTLTRFSAPAEVKNEAILFLENDRGENDVLLYLPAYQKTRRVERSQQSSSFMGSDFSYSDITTPHVDDYKYELKAEEACPVAAGETAEAPTCHRVEAEPATPAVRERTGYSKVVSWVRKDNFMIVRNENFDLDRKPVKQSSLSKIQKLANGKWLAHRIEVISLKSGGRTTLEFSDVDTESKMDDSLFTQQSLGRGVR